MNSSRKDLVATNVYSLLLFTALLCLSLFSNAQQEPRALSVEVLSNSEQQEKRLPDEQKSSTALSDQREANSPLAQDVEAIKKAALELNRDLLILEEELLFPANTQIAVFVSLDVGHYFNLDAVKLHVDDKLVASHLYTEKQNKALARGGVQRLYLGNIKTGQHEITAFFHGYGPKEREYKRGASYTLTKNQSPAMLEIRIRDSQKAMQPTFDFKEWQL